MIKAVDEATFQRQLVANIVRICHKNGITTTELGKKIGAGAMIMREYEHCLTPIPLLRLYAMAKVLKISMAKLFESAEQPDNMLAEVEL